MGMIIPDHTIRNCVIINKLYAGTTGKISGDGYMIHEPVLYREVKEHLSCASGGVIVDATVGHGGHARHLGEGLSEEGLLLGLDVDEGCLARARERLSELKCQVKLIRENFGRLDEVLASEGISKVDVILADLGVNSAQLEDSERGISFQRDGFLDMRLDGRLKRTAADIVNQTPEKELADLIYKYGEERFSRRIAKRIAEARRKKRLSTTGELVSVINKALGIRGDGRRGRIHPATRTFQALRIVVNDELGQLERLLKLVPDWLKVGGRVGIISFHSLEDRLVKFDFRENKQAGRYKVITKKPLVAQQDERRSNPRSRSAKFRVAVYNGQ